MCNRKYISELIVLINIITYKYLINFILKVNKIVNNKMTVILTVYKSPNVNFENTFRKVNLFQVQKPERIKTTFQ